MAFRHLSRAVFLSAALVWAAQPDLPQVLPHPPIELDIPVEPDRAWDTQDAVPHISFASTDSVFERHRVPRLARETLSWSAVAWRGERVHAQVLVWSKAGLSQLRGVPTELKSSRGETIAATAARVRFVRYVVSELPPGTRKTHCDEIDQKTAYLVPDLLDPFPQFDLVPSTTRPVWITVDVPRDAAPGTYTGSVRFLAKGFDRSVSLTLEVQGGTVPPPAQWGFRTDFWQNPWAVAYQHRVPPWSEAHLAVLRQHLRALADMGQTYISTYITHSPWKDDTYIPDGTMVEWIREADGSFSFDYRIFDTYVEVAMSSGIDDAICCFTMIPWNGRVRYLDRRSGEYVWATWPTDSPEYAKFWKAALADLRAHLVKRGWYGKTYLEVNERSLADTLRAVRIAREDAPDWKFTYAGSYHPELVEPIDDLCTVVDRETPAQQIVSRRNRGRTSTFYVACTPAYPNNFPFSPPAENVWMGWHAAASGLDGFLRWAWDSWPADPLRDARHFRFPGGDTFLVYPGPLASIRMERLREGFVDCEKIRIVRQKLRADPGGPAQQAMARLEKALSSFTWDRAQSAEGGNIARDIDLARQALAAATRIAFR